MNKLARAAVWICTVAAVLLAFWLAPGGAEVRQAVGHWIDLLQTNGDTLRGEVLGYGAMAPFAFMGLQILQVLLAPLPGEATGILGGYLFGLWPGFLYSSAALAVGSGLAFGLGHLLRNLLRKRFEGSELYRKFNHLVHKGDYMIPFLLFLFPGFPKDSLSYLMGLSRMPLPVFLFIAGLARMPGTLMLSMQGAQVYQEDYLQLALVTGLMLAVSLPFFFFHRQILSFLTSFQRRREENGSGQGTGGGAP